MNRSSPPHLVYDHDRPWNDRFMGTPNDPKLPKYFRSYFGAPSLFSMDWLIDEQMGRSPDDYKAAIIDPVEEFNKFKEWLKEQSYNLF